MKIVIGLNQTDFVCLRDKIPDDSSLRQVFKPWQNDDDESGYDEFKQTGPGIPLTAEIQIHCSKEEGEQLLALLGGLSVALTQILEFAFRSSRWPGTMRGSCA